MNIILGMPDDSSDESRNECLTRNLCRFDEAEPRLLVELLKVYNSDYGRTEACKIIAHKISGEINQSQLIDMLKLIKYDKSRIILVSEFALWINSKDMYGLRYLFESDNGFNEACYAIESRHVAMGKRNGLNSNQGVKVDKVIEPDVEKETITEEIVINGDEFVVNLSLNKTKKLVDNNYVILITRYPGRKFKIDISNIDSNINRFVTVLCPGPIKINEFLITSGSVWLDLN